MSYLSDILKRADLQHIRAYLLHGGELLKPDHAPYEQRLEDSLEPVNQLLMQFPPEQRESLEQTIMQAISAYQDVYMEIGLQVGAILAENLHSKAWMRG